MSVFFSCGVGRFGDLGGGLFLLVAVFVSLHDQLAAFFGQFDDRPDIDAHAAVAAIFLHLVGVLTQKLQIEHRGPSKRVLSPLVRPTFMRRHKPVRRRPHVRLGQFAPQMGAGPGAAVEIGQGEVFVGAVQIVRILAPTQEECIDSQDVPEGSDDGDRTPLADHHRLGPEGARAIARRAACMKRTFAVENQPRAAVERAEFQPQARRTIFLQEPLDCRAAAFPDSDWAPAGK